GTPDRTACSPRAAARSKRRRCLAPTAWLTSASNRGGQPLVTTGCGYLPIGYLPTGYLPIGALPTGGAGGGGSLRGRSAAAAAPSMAKDAAVAVRIFSIMTPHVRSGPNLPPMAVPDNGKCLS